MSEVLITNETDFGGKLYKRFSADLASSNGLLVASGYFGADLVSDFEEKLVELGKKGTCKLLLGMVYHSGVGKKQLETLKSIDTKLRNDNPDNGIFIRRKQYHGKIYKLNSNNDFKIYIGSSNFSNSGFKSRTECNIEIDNDKTKKDIDSFLDFLFTDSTTEKFSDVELFLKDRKRTEITRGLKNCEIDISEFPDESKVIGLCKIKLRVDSQPQSSLNLFFDKGRKNPNGLYSPRPWHEVELTADSEELKGEYYPKSKLLHPDQITKSGQTSKTRKGDFIAYTKDNGKYYRIKMKVHADNGKNISSAKESGGRTTLGELIKGKLERAKVLSYRERITSDTLYAYGRDSIDLKKLSNDTYIIDF